MRLISPCLPNLEMEVDSQSSSFLSQHFIARNSARRDLLIINLRTDNSGLQVHHDSPGNMLPGSGLGEESVETVVSGSDGLVRRHLDNYTC